MLETLRIDRYSSLPPRRQLAGQIRALIDTGRIRSGERLPSVRWLAAHLQLNYNTVAAAYRGLADSGHLDLRRGAGTRVRWRPPQGSRAALPVALAGQVAQTARRHGHDPAEVGRLLIEGQWPAAPPPRVAVVSTGTPADELAHSFTVLTGSAGAMVLHAFDLASFDPQGGWDLVITDPGTLGLAQRGAAQPAGRAAPALAQSAEYRRHYLELAVGAD